MGMVVVEKILHDKNKLNYKKNAIFHFVNN